MGVISDLVRMKGEKDLQQKQGTIDALKIVLSNPEATPEAREWATTSLTGLLDGEFSGKGTKGKGGSGGGGGGGSGGNSGSGGSGGGGVGSFFHHMLSGLNHLNPYTASAGTKQASQQIAANRPQKMTLTPDEQEQTKLKNQKIEAEQKLQQDAAKIELENKSKFQLDKKLAKFKDRQDLKAENEKWHLVYNREISLGKTPEEAARLADEAVAGIKSPTESSTEKLTLLGPKGEEVVLFRSPATGKVFNIAHREVNVDEMLASGQYKYKDSAEADKGTKFNEWKTILRSQHPEWEHDRIEKEAGLKAAAQIAEETDAKRTRLNITLQNAANRTSAVADAPDIAQAIMNGEQPPDSAGLSRSGAWMKIRDDLAKKGFNLTKAELDWKAAQRYVATLNGSQQVRIREAASTVSQMLPDIRNKYDTWRKAGLASGIKIFNRAALVASKNLPGPAGVAAQALETQIADMVAELGQLYMGGNSPTDHSLKLAEQNLKGDWTPEQFNAALDLLKNNLSYRVNSIMNAGAAGMSEGSPYMPTGGEGVKTQPTTQPTNAADYLKRIRGK